MADEEDDILATLGIPPAKPKTKPPPRPPPPGRSATLPVLPVIGKEHRQTGFEKVHIPPPLQPHEVRWFYQEPGKFWQSFGGYDSLRLEQCQLDLMGWGQEGPGLPIDEEEKEKKGHVSVMGDLYSVHVEDRVMHPIYWPCGKEKWKVMRGMWFEVVGEKWYPFMEADYSTIEAEHCQRKWRETAKKDAELQAWANTRPNPSPSPSRSPSSGRSVSTSSASTSSASSVATSTSSSAEALEDLGTVVVNKLAMEKYDIVWLANGDVYKMKKELGSQLWNKMGQKFGKGALFGGTKVMRGYKEWASSEDRLPPIGHVVFVTHGIGQNMNASSIEQSTRDFREACTKVGKNSFGDHWNEKRVEFIPVEWRTGLSLDKGLVNTITPNTLKLLRGMVNDCVMDVFYYFSPKFGPEILNGLKTALQKQYNEFIRRNPHFVSNGGTVSVIAHSLGSVMLYDILREKCDLDPEIQATIRAARMSESNSSRQSPLASSGGVGLDGGSLGGSLVEWRGKECAQGESGVEYVDGEVMEAEVSEEARMREELASLKKRVACLEHQLVLKKPPEPLSFSIDHFFAFGSPTALFIAMKEYETLVSKGHRSAESFLPSCVCKRIHNVQHPSDPIAYRLEPLVNPNYAQVKPVKMSSAKSKISQDMVDLAEGPRTEKDLEGQQQQSGKSWWANQLQSVGNSLMNFASGKKTPAAGATGTDSNAPPPEKVLNDDKQLHPRIKLKERLDFMMKESAMENSYLNSITAHHSYWSSADCAQYVLLQLYKYKPQS